MDPSIMKLLEEDEDETMHSGADVEAFTAALNRDIGGGDNSQSQPSYSDSVRLSQASSYTSYQFAPWQTSNHEENVSRQSLQGSENVQQKEGNLSDTQLKQQDADSQNQPQKNDSSQEISSLPLQQTTDVEQDTLHAPKKVNMNVQNPEKNTLHLESQHLNFQVANKQQAMQSLTTGTSGLPLAAADASSQSELASGSSSQAAMNIAKQGKLPFAMLYPLIEPQLDKDRQMQFQTLHAKLKASRNLQSVPGQFIPQSQASQQQHLQMPVDDSSSLAVESNAQKLHEVERQGNLRGAQGSQMPSSLTGLKQERDHSPFPVQGLNRQQQQHLHFSQASFPTSPNTRNNNNVYYVSNVNSSRTLPLKQQSDNAQMRQLSAQQNRNATHLGVPTQAVRTMGSPKPNTFGEDKTLPGGSLNISNTSRIQQINKEQKSIFQSPMTNLKSEPIDHFHDHLQKSHLSPFSSVQAEQGNSTLGSSKDEFIERNPRVGPSTTITMRPSNSVSSSMSSHMDTSTLLSSQTPSVASPFGPGNMGKTPVKKPSVGQKKPLDALGSSPPPSGFHRKKQKVSGAFLDQSIEQLNDVTAVSGVNLREEEEQLFSGSKEDSRSSEASRRVVQEEEERLILQEIPLQKKLIEIMGKCGLKNMSSHVEKCLSLCVEERMRGLINSLIRLSKQSVDIEKSRHRTIVTSDVREEIMSINRKAREEWEKKQADAEKLQKANDPEGSTGVDGDKEKDDGRGKSIQVNKEEDDKMRTTAANVAARAAVGGDDMLSKWQLMAEQARQKREGGADVASGSQPGKDLTNSSAPTRSSRDHQEAEKRSQSSATAAPGTARKPERNQAITHPRIARSITVKDVIAVLDREPQMSKSTLIYRLYEKKARSDVAAESS